MGCSIRICCLAVVGILALLPHVAMAVPTPVLDYRFNDRTYTYTGATQPGSGAVSLGTDTTPLAFRNHDTTFPAGNGQSVNFGDFIASANNGLTGQPGDHAFQPDTTSMGGDGNSDAESAVIPTSVNGPTSLTLAGWYKSRSGVAISGGARLIRDHDVANTGFSLHQQGADGVLQLEIDNSTVNSAAGYIASANWVFWAATYDGTKTSNNVRFFIGSPTSAVSQVGGDLSINEGAIDASSSFFSIGNGRIRNSAFDGFLDDVKVFDATSGAGGALSQTDLEAVRQADLVPEPTSAGILGVCSIGLFIRRRRR